MRYGREDLDDAFEPPPGDGDRLGLSEKAALVGVDGRGAGHFRGSDDLAEVGQPDGDRLARRKPDALQRDAVFDDIALVVEPALAVPDEILFGGQVAVGCHDAVALDAEGIDQERIAVLHRVVGVDHDPDEIVGVHVVPLGQGGLDLGRFRVIAPEGEVEVVGIVQEIRLGLLAGLLAVVRLKRLEFRHGVSPVPFAGIELAVDDGGLGRGGQLESRQGGKKNGKKNSGQGNRGDEFSQAGVHVEILRKATARQSSLTARSFGYTVRREKRFMSTFSSARESFLL